MSAASPDTITLGGVTLKVNTGLISRVDEIKAIIVESRPDPFVIVAQARSVLGDDPSTMQHLLRCAMNEAMERDTVTAKQLRTFINDTMEGTVVMLWLAVRDNDPATYTRDRVRELLFRELDDIAAARGVAAQEARLKELSAAVDSAA